MSLIFDTHAHYDDEAFDADREALLASMPEHGVGLILDPGCDLESSRRAVELARTYPRVYAAVGWQFQPLAIPGSTGFPVVERIVLASVGFLLVVGVRYPFKR